MFSAYLGPPVRRLLPAVKRLRPCPASPRRKLSSLAAIQSQIESFPEFKLASEQEVKGNFELALPNFMRVKDVMVSTTGGPLTDYSVAVALRIANLYCSMGKYEEALRTLGDIKEYPDGHLKVLAYQSASSCYMLDGSDVYAALDAAGEAAAVCESLSCGQDNEDHYHLFSKNYTLQGLSCLLLGQPSAAEEHLQLAARWAEHPIDKLISLSNIGSLLCTMGDFLPPIYDNSSVCFPPKDDTSRELVRKSNLIRDGLEYWQEAATEAISEKSLPNAANAMCGPFENSSPLGPGMDAIEIPPAHGKDKEINDNAFGVGNSLNDTLSMDSTGCFTRAYATVLCNIAEAEIKLGDKGSAAQSISSAIAALNLNMQNSPQNSFMLSSVLGRCLYLSGCDHYHGGDFVVAEGLFRSAIEKFQMNSFCEVDTRHSHELMRTMHSYGSLLQKWDKRESEGEKWISKSHALSATIPTYPVRHGSSRQGESAQMSHFLLSLPSVQ